jgi:tetratricopeptide (TPR) repeat protein
MWLLAKSGQREAAIAQYALCKQLRREQLDVPLLEETELLYEQVLEGDFAPTFAQWEAVPAAESGPSVPEVSPDHGEWPALSEAGRYALETLSLAVCPLSLHSLSLASHQSESEIVAAIEHGLALGWLATDVDGERYSFIDDQVKASFSSGLSAIRCQLLHKHLAEALRQVHATSAELAYHWGEAGCRQQECEALQSAAKDALDAHQFHEVARCYGRCVALSQTASEQVSFLQLSGEALQVLGRWREAEEAFTTSLALAKQARLPSTLAQSALLLGQFALAKSDWSRSLHWLEQAKGAFEALGEQEGVFLVWGHLSSLFRRQGDMEKALSACKMQVSVADSLGNNTLRSKAQGALSGLYAQMGREEEALDCFRETLTLASQMPSLLSLTSEGDERYEYIEQKGGMQTISRLLERSAWLEAEQDQFLQAMQIVEEQLRFHLDSGQTERVHRGWEQLSSWYAWMGDVEHSMRFALRLFGLAVERMSFPGLAQSAGNIGALYTRYGDGQKARVCYQMKCSLSLDLQEPRGVSNGLRHLAELSWCEGDEAMAFSCLSLATTLCQQNQLQTGLSSCLLLGFALRSSSDAGAWRDFVERFGDAVPASEPDFEAEVERAARRLYDLRHAMQQPKPSPELPALMQQQHQTVEDVLHRASKVFGIDVVLLG